MSSFTVDLFSGLGVGFIAAAALYAAWIPRIGYASPWVILGSAGAGFAVGIIALGVAFLAYAGTAWRL